MDLQDLLDGAIYVIFAWRLGVEDLDWECTSRNVEAWRVAVERGEFLCIHRG